MSTVSLVKPLVGERIDIAPDSTTFLNVLDLSDDNMDEDPIKVKSEFLLSWIGKLLDRKMDGREKEIPNWPCV